MQNEDVIEALMDCAREVMKEWRPKASFDLDRDLGAGGYMFDDWGSVRSLAEEIIDCIEQKLDIADDVIQLPGSYPPASIRDGTLGDLCNDLAFRVVKGLEA